MQQGFSLKMELHPADAEINGIMHDFLIEAEIHEAEAPGYFIVFRRAQLVLQANQAKGTVQVAAVRRLNDYRFRALARPAG
jgi:hypothetical protein